MPNGRSPQRFSSPRAVLHQEARVCWAPGMAPGATTLRRFFGRTSAQGRASLAPPPATQGWWPSLLAGIWVVALAFVLAGPSWAQACAQLSAPRSVSDGRSGCLAVVPVPASPPSGSPMTAAAGAPDTSVTSEGATAAGHTIRILVVLLHGDRGGSLEQRHLDRWLEVGRSLRADDRKVLFMVRPGYRTPLGNSSGWANPYDDDYTAENVARVAGAVSALRQSHQASRVVVVGHSGGAAITALLLGRHPGVADAALLLACPCDIPPWREHRNMQRGGGDRKWTSLNPRAFLADIAPGTPVIAATGVEDDNTLPHFAKHWVEQAAARGVRAVFEAVPGHDHGSILRWEGIAHRLQTLIAALPP